MELNAGRTVCARFLSTRSMSALIKLLRLSSLSSVSFPPTLSCCVSRLHDLTCPSKPPGMSFCFSYLRPSTVCLFSSSPILEMSAHIPLSAASKSTNRETALTWDALPGISCGGNMCFVLQQVLTEPAEEHEHSYALSFFSFSVAVFRHATVAARL